MATRGGTGRRGAGLLRANVREAAANLYAAKQRSILALVGIVIGVSSVIALVSVGEIVQNEALEQFEALGTNVLSVSLSGSNSPRTSLNARQALGLASVDAIEVAAPYSVWHTQGSYAAGVLPMMAIAVTEAWAEMFRTRMERGRFISDLDGQSPYCVVGAAVADALRRRGGTTLIGDAILVEDEVLTIVGVLEPGNVPNMHFRVDDSILMPVGTAARKFGQRHIQDVGARFRSGVHHLDAAEQVRAYFRRVSKQLVVDLTTARALIEQMQKQSRMFTLMLGAIGSISLVVGGIGIMNVMLVSVAERRLEIGVRRALGARRNDIQSQFLTEAVILSLCGGVLGVGMGVGAAYAISAFAGWTFAISTAAIGLGGGTACAVGVLFGFLPAYQAARLDTIAILRGN